jgi:hypothetical protein
VVDAHVFELSSVHKTVWTDEWWSLMHLELSILPSLLLSIIACVTDCKLIQTNACAIYISMRLGLQHPSTPASPVIVSETFVLMLVIQGIYL